MGHNGTPLGVGQQQTDGKQPSHHDPVVIVRSENILYVQLSGKQRKEQRIRPASHWTPDGL